MKTIVIIALFVTLFTSQASASADFNGLPQSLEGGSVHELIQTYDLVKARLERSVSEDIQNRFKEFTDRLGKMPDQLGDALKKFLQERGISVENIQNILKDIWEAMQKLVEQVQKALNS